MDPVGTNTMSSPGTFQDYVPYAPKLGFGNGVRVSDSRTYSASSQSASLLHALELAADRTATTIAQGTKQASLDVRDRLGEVVQWLVASLQNKSADTAPCPPVIAREYVSTLKVNFLAEL